MMSDLFADYLAGLCPEKQVVKIENEFKGDRAKIYLLDGTIKGEKITKNDRTPWLEKMLHDSELPAICSDSQIFLEALDMILSEQGRRGIRVDSKTTSESRVKEFFKDPSAFIERERVEYVLYSPSAESGLDIPITGYFTEHFGFFFGAIDVDSIMQMMGRIRDKDVDKYIWVKLFAPTNPNDCSHNSFNADVIAQASHQVMSREIHAVMSGEKNSTEIMAETLKVLQESKDSHCDLATRLEALNNYERSNLRECVNLSSLAAGHDVETVLVDELLDKKGIKALEKDAKDSVKNQNAIDIFNAPDVPEGTEVKLSFDASWEKRCQASKAALLKKLPGIKDSAVWSPSFIKLVTYDKPNLIAGCELLWLTYHPEVAKQLAKEKWHRVFEAGQLGEKVAPWKMRQQYEVVKALIESGILNLLENPEKVYTADSPEIKAIVKACSKKSITQALGRSPGKDAVRFVGSLLSMIGLEWESKRQRKSGTDERYHIYYLTEEILNQTERVAIIEAIEKKYLPRLNGKSPKLVWHLRAKTEKKQGIKITPQKTAETQSTHGANPVPDAIHFVYNIQGHLGQNQIDNSTLDSPYDSKEISEILELTDSQGGWGSLEGFKFWDTPSVESAIESLEDEKKRQVYRWLGDKAMDLESEIKEMAKILDLCDDRETIYSLVTTTVGWTPERVRRAMKYLSQDKQPLVEYALAQLGAAA